MNGIVLTDVLMKTVDRILYLDDIEESLQLCITTNNGLYLNFNAEDFRYHLSCVIEHGNTWKKLDAKNKVNLSKTVTEVMKNFKALKWLVCENGRFTNSQCINGRTRRVITVDKEVYDKLKELDWQQPEGELGNSGKEK